MVDLTIHIYTIFSWTSPLPHLPPPLQAAATTVKHMMLPCHFSLRPALVRDLITSYGLGGRSIVFTDTKADANDLAVTLSDAG